MGEMEASPDSKAVHFEHLPVTNQRRVGLRSTCDARTIS